MKQVAVIIFSGGWGRDGMGQEGCGRGVISSCRAAAALHLDVIEEQRRDALDNGLQQRTSALAGGGALL